MSSPLISIIVPVYDVEPYLKRCLDSIVNQSYRSLEIILVDDGSPDRCGAICDEYANKDGRIIVIHQENKGLSEARNTGLNNVTGDYIQFVDSDDWLELNACESALNSALNHAADYVCFGYKHVDSSGGVLSRIMNPTGKQDKAQIVKWMAWDRWTGRDFVWNKLYASRLFDGVRFPSGKRYEDIGIQHWLLFNSTSIYISDMALYNYFKRPGAITSTSAQFRDQMERFSMYEERLEFLQHHFPESANIQLAVMLRKLLILRHDRLYRPHKKEIDESIHRLSIDYKENLKKATRYSRVVWVYMFCRPFTSLAINWRPEQA